MADTVKDTVGSDTDEAIAKAVQEGDIDAFGELVSRYEVKLKRYARKFLARDDDVEDLVQDVFIKAYENIQSFKSNLRFSPWIYRIAHNAFVNELRRKSKWGMVFDSDAMLPLMPASETADEETLKIELKTEAEGLIEMLPAKYREVVVLYHFEELSYEEISDVLHIPTSTVGVRMNRARKKLKEAFLESNNTET